MSKSTNALDYFHRLESAIVSCKSISPGDRLLPHRKDDRKRIWVVVRGFPVPKLFEADASAARPFALLCGGTLRFRAQIREVIEKYASPHVEVEAYRLCVENLNKEGNPNHVECFRYDRPARLPQGPGWNDDLGDNPEHPHGHLHVNFSLPDANDLRMPTGAVCPILLIKAFDYWYYNTYVR